MTDTPNPISNLSPDDPDLTAYALGELDPGSDVYKQVEARLEADPEARAFVEQARALGEQLETSFRATDSSAGLSEHQQKELTAMIDKQDQPSEPVSETTAAPRQGFRMPTKLLLAAGLALAATAAITTVVVMNNDTPSITQDDVTPVSGLAAVSEAIVKPVAVDFDNAKLGDVFGFLYKQTGVKIETDWDALGTRGVTPETRVTLAHDEPVPANAVLTVALQAAWQQSPHPDPAQWAVNDDGVSVAPKSALVQARLDEVAKLLEGRRFGVAAVDQKMLTSNKAEVWDSSLWNDIRTKRAEAGKAVMAEVFAMLDAADQAAAKDEFHAASDQGVYAYRLLAMNSAVLQQDDFAKPLERIGKLQQTVYDRQLVLDKAAITQAAADAKANDTELNDHQSALLAAVEAMDNGSYDAALQAVVKASEALTADDKLYEKPEYTDWAYRTVRIQNEIASEIHYTEGQQLAEVQEEILNGTLSEDDKKDKLQGHLKNARYYQLHGDYNSALAEVTRAQGLAPEDQAIESLSVMLKESELAKSSTKLNRSRELGEATLSLLNIEAATPRGESISGYGGKLEKRREFKKQMQVGRVVAGKPGQSLHWHSASDASDSLGLAPKYDEQVTNYFSLVTDGKGKFGAALDPVAGTRITGMKSKAISDRRGRDTSGGLFADDYVARGGRYNNSRGVVDGLATLGDLPAPGPSAVNRPVIVNERAEFDAAFPEAPSEPTREARWRVEAQRQQLQQQQVAQAPADKSRKERLERSLEKLVDIDKEAELENGERELLNRQRESLEQAIERAAKNEPLEIARIQAIKELGEMEREFIDRSREALIVDPQMSRDAYAVVNDNPFYNTADEGRAMSTFSVDVDTAAYTLVRRQLEQQNRLPVPGAVRIEEMINYFDYNYDAPVVDGRALKDGVVTQASLEQFEKEQEGFAPFATHVQVTDCPWQDGHRLMRIGVKGMEVAQDERPPCHLTFLLDVSGSMSSANKLPLVKQSLKLLLDKLNDKDRVSIVVYAGRTATVLENASAANKQQIIDAMDKLKSGGSTAGAAGIQLAYDAAKKHYIDGGVNRVILCTDGDFNVGIRDTDDLVALIKKKANPEADEDGKRRGVYLSVMGYGMGNLNDAMMEPLTNAGNGTYAYIDTLKEAEKVMYDQAGSTLVTIAKDVKIQVHFDPTQVMAYRLIGYENRVLANEDFANDKVDAGDIGSGHSVTAIYEVVPFEDNDLWQEGEGVFEVKKQIDDLDHAIALNQSLMQTCALNQEQTLKLQASTRLLTQERMLAKAVVNKLEAKQKPGADQDAEAAEGEAPRVGEAPAVEGADDAPAKPVVELDKFEDGAMIAVKLRYKPVDAPAEDGTSRLIQERVFADQAIAFELSDESTRFAASVAAYGMLLRSSPHAGNATLGWVIDTAEAASGHDPSQYKAQFRDLVQQTLKLMPQKQPEPPKAVQPEPVPLPAAR